MGVRIISASVGSFLTAIATTPLDVAKTRMQLVGTPAATCVEPSSTDTAPIRQPVRRPVGVQHSMFETLTAVARAEGMPALWSGIGPSLILAVPSAVLYYALYDEMKDRLQDASTPGSTLHDTAPLVAGMAGRGCTAALVSPLELLRTRAMMQLRGADGGRVSALASLRKDVRSSGIGTLWRGLSPTLWRDVPFSGIYWGTYEWVKLRLGREILRRRTGSRTDFGAANGGTQDHVEVRLSMSETYAVTFMSGSFAGALAATLTTPFDVVKTRRQAVGTAPEPALSTACGCPPGVHGPLPGASGASVSSTAVSRGSGSLSTTAALLFRIAASEGLPGLFSGLPARVAKVAPACAIMISSYELGKRAFLEQQQDQQKLGET